MKRSELHGFPHDVQDQFMEVYDRISYYAQLKDWKKAIDLSILANYIIPNRWRLLHNLCVFIIYITDQENELKRLYGDKRGEKIRDHYLDQGEYFAEIAILSLPEIPTGTLYNLARIQCRNKNIGGAAQSFAILNYMLDSLPEHLSKAIAKGEADFDIEGITDLPEFSDLVIACRIKHSDIKIESYTDITSESEFQHANPSKFR